MTTQNDPCSALTNWDGDTAGWAPSSGTLVKSVDTFGFMTLDLPVSTSDHMAEGQWISASNPGWWNNVLVRCPQNVGLTGLYGYALEVRDSPVGSNLWLYRIVNGVVTEMLQWAPCPNPTTNIRLQATGTGSTVSLQGWQLNGVSGLYVSVGTTTDVHANRIVTNLRMGIGGYGGKTINDVTITDVGGAAPVTNKFFPFF